MELRPVPMPARTTRRWYAAAAGASVVPFLLLVVVPTALGLHRFVVGSDAMRGSLSTGTLILTQQVPVSDLAAGDVISFVPPAPYEGRVTRRVVSVAPAGVRTGSDDRADPWIVPAGSAGVDRMVLHVPWIGYPFLGPLGRGSWALLLALPIVVISLVLARDQRRRRSPAAAAEAAEEPVRPVVPQ